MAVNGIAFEEGVTLMLPLVRIGLSDPNTTPVDENCAVPVIVIASVSVDVRLVLIVRPVKALSCRMPPTFDGMVTPGLPSHPSRRTCAACQSGSGYRRERYRLADHRREYRFRHCRLEVARTAV